MKPSKGVSGQSPWVGVGSAGNGRMKPLRCRSCRSRQAVAREDSVIQCEGETHGGDGEASTTCEGSREAWLAGRTAERRPNVQMRTTVDAEATKKKNTNFLGSKMQRQSMVLENQSTPVTAASCETPMQWLGSLGRRGTTQCVPDWGRVPLLGLCQGTRKRVGEGSGIVQVRKDPTSRDGRGVCIPPPGHD